MKKKLIAALATMVVSVTAFAGCANADNVAKDLGNQIKAEAIQLKTNNGQAVANQIKTNDGQTVANNEQNNLDNSIATTTESLENNENEDQECLDNNISIVGASDTESESDITSDYTENNQNITSNEQTIPQQPSDSNLKPQNEQTKVPNVVETETTTTKAPETNTNNNEKVDNQPVVNNNSSVKYMADFEADILKYTNIERQKAGLEPLKLNNTAFGFARSKSEEMIRLNYFDHNSPENGYISDVAKKNNWRYSYIGENIYTMSYSGDITTVINGQKIVDAWMNSPGHRANILNANFKEIGIGVAYANGELMATQLFYTP
ncbi:hypothetical protein CPJCM30710_24150 [Clostridium polyendosporum]|uniref:SCP domain-containing protein n=1 Tax=Clostridium polyendosporum TaxID=69208 RepID=A0A919S1K0_9CLOT|nr:CAP domain-containing protein [Clostridium polyendosporum]GIM29749.1 hypothetical protein CPJCM30710_24150 [Clostridium polyendosporum]